MVEDKVENVCDLSYLTEIMGGKKHLIKGILDTFLTQIPEELNSIKEAILKADYENIRRFAHTMKSSVSIVGISLLTPVLKEMEESAITLAGIEKIKELNQRLNLICGKAIIEIEKARPNYV